MPQASADRGATRRRLYGPQGRQPAALLRSHRGPDRVSSRNATMMPSDGRSRATERPRNSRTESAGYLGEFTLVSFRWPVSIYKSSKRHLTAAVVVLVLAIIGSLGAILLRSGAAAQADASIVDLRKSLP